MSIDFSKSDTVFTRKNSYKRASRNLIKVADNGIQRWAGDFGEGAGGVGGSSGVGGHGDGGRVEAPTKGATEERRSEREVTDNDNRVRRGCFAYQP